MDETALIRAAKAGDGAEVERLLAGSADLALRDPTSPRRCTSPVGGSPCAGKASPTGAPINASTESYQTPLDWAVQSGRPELVAFLRARGARPGERLR